MKVRNHRYLLAPGHIKKEGTVLVLGDLELPDRHREPLQRGLKFCVAPVLIPAEKVELSRSVTRQVKEEEKPRCFAECVKVFASRNVRQTVTSGFWPLIRFLANSGSRIAVSDKESFFVVLPEGMFFDKAKSAINKNFREIKENAIAFKRCAVKFLGDLNLCRLFSSVKSEKGLMLEAFFTIKFHKPEYPFRTIVSEKGSWPHLVSGYLPKHLESLRLSDRFLVRNSNDVVYYLRTNGAMVSDAFSVDVVDLYYSIPHAPLLQSVKECIINDNVEVVFRNASGVSVEGFLELLALHSQIDTGCVGRESAHPPNFLPISRERRPFGQSAPYDGAIWQTRRE